jgi:hypothetical protein
MSFTNQEYCESVVFGMIDDVFIKDCQKKIILLLNKIQTSKNDFNKK